MTDETVDRRALDRHPGQQAGHGGREVLLHEGRNGAGENHAEAFRVDVPAHEVEGAGPAMLARAVDRGETARPGLHHAGRGAVAEERGRDDVRLGEFVEPEGERAQLDNDEKHGRARPRFREPGRDRKARHAAGAAEPEHGHAAHILAKSHPGRGARFEAWRRDAGGRDGHDDVDFATAKPCGFERRLGPRHEQRLRAFQKGGCAFGPASRLDIPFDRPHRMTLRDACRIEHIRQPLELAIAAAEDGARCARHIALPENMGRKRRCERNEMGA